MPIYQYRCENGHEFEALQKMSDPPLEQCQFCLAKAHRQISLFNYPQGTGIYLFDRQYGDKDVLHDPTFSNRERRRIISDLTK